MTKENVAYKKFYEPCKDDTALRFLVEHFLHLKLPQSNVCEGHVSPFEYLRSAYFEPARDLVVWAPRGGGKTRLGAVATLFDLLHKEGAAVRILGGSLEQSLRMWEHLLPDLNEYAKHRIDGKIRADRVRLTNGSAAGVVTQSERAVRGLRVQKLRCDEVEMFDENVWQAAQLITRTIRRDDGRVLASGAVEALSTCHRPGGLMERVMDNAHATGVRVLKWCLLEILERCPQERECAACPLHDECQGVAKTRCDGFLSIDDAIAMKKRVSKETWEAEMLCRRPSANGCVFQTFDPDHHVRPSLPAPPTDAIERHDRAGLYLGVDFGYRNPFVCLWIFRDVFGRSFVVDEYVKSEAPIDEHIDRINDRKHGPVRRLCCDPAGASPNEQTAHSNIQRLRQAGFKVTARGSKIAEGLEQIRAGLRTAAGGSSLFVHPRCAQLTRAMRAYRYAPGRSEIPEKTGPDHLVDALRYYYIARDAGESRTALY